MVPAWKLQELLDQEQFTVQRRRDDDRVSRRKKGNSAAFDTHKPDQNEEKPPFSRDDFFRALRKTARKQNQPLRPDQEKR